MIIWQGNASNSLEKGQGYARYLSQEETLLSQSIPIKLKNVKLFVLKLSQPFLKPLQQQLS